MKFGFIGAGKVGFSLGKYLTVHAKCLSGYYSMIRQDAVEAAAFTGSKCYESMEELVEDSDVLFLTVSDGAIASVWKQLKECHIKNKIVCHCSGAMSTDVFSDITDYTCFCYSIHPLFAVSNQYESYKELSNSYFTIEGSPEKIGEMKKLFEDLGNPVCILSKNDKVKYHAAAAIASNLVVGLIDLSENLLQECGFDKQAAHEALTPIIMGNIRHIIKDGTMGALTGPMERNDMETVSKHLAVLEGNDREIYVSLSKQILSIAKQKNKEKNYGEMEEILQ